MTTVNYIWAKIRNRTKHIDALSKHSGIRYHWIRELIIAGLIELKHVSSLNNESDLFTKPLGSTIHERLKTKVMNKKTDENEPTKETSSNFSMNYEFTTSIDDELKSLIFTNGIWTRFITTFMLHVKESRGCVGLSA